ncbi:MAG: ABC transporter permease [Actinobacteria bacterium]|nr:ABC transporter permease [Actinomycetota bacterium]
MVGRVPLARRNLFQDRRRVGLTVLGIAVSALLVLVLDGIFAGSMRQVTSYIRSSPADVWVSQRSVRTLHMSNSALPPETLDAVRGVQGVAWAEPLYYTTNVVEASDGTRRLTYVFGYEPEPGRVGPVEITRGRGPRSGEVVIDDVTADELALGVGDRVSVMGRNLRISGVSARNTNIINTIVFIPARDFRAAHGEAVSYVLAGSEEGAAADQLAKRIAAAVPDTTVQTRSEFTSQERRIVRDMSTDIIRIMTVVALLIGLAVVGLSLLALTLAKQREYGVVRALGAGPGRLAAGVIAQAGWSVVVGFALAVVLALAVGQGLARFTPNVRVAYELPAIARTFVRLLLIGMTGALVPLRRVLRIDPASAFRGS